MSEITTFPIPTVPLDPAAIVTNAAAKAELDSQYAPLAAGLSGTGSPEGVVTATPGTVYRDTAATNGAVVWVKASGSGNTGWRVVFGDTGWRNVSADLTNGWALAAGGYFVMRRDGAQVSLIASVSAAAATTMDVCDVPTGFRSRQGGLGHFVPLPVEFPTTAAPFRVNGANNRVQTSTTVSGAIYRFAGSWLTSDAWPSTLPGSAA